MDLIYGIGVLGWRSSGYDEALGNVEVIGELGIIGKGEVESF